MKGFYLGSIPNFAFSEKLDEFCSELCLYFQIKTAGIRAVQLPRKISKELLNATCFIMCSTALPHNDSENFPNKCFLTLVIQSNHWIGCESYISDKLKSRVAVRGDVFLIDADETHWAIPEEKGDLFFGIQWDFDKSDPMLQEKIDAVLAKLRV